MSFAKNSFMRTAVTASTLAIALSGCSGFSQDKKKEEEAIKNTVVCMQGEDRLLIRFNRDEVRLLMPGGELVYLYQMPSSRGVLYTNGNYELLGKGTNVTFGPVGELAKLSCKPYGDDDKEQRDDDRKGLKEVTTY